MHGEVYKSLAEPRVGIYRGQADYSEAEAAVRSALAFAGLGGSSPLEGLVVPGDLVLIKPNLIREAHATRENEWEQVVTHGAIIRVIADLVADALKGKGKVVIADGPQTDSDFEAIRLKLGLDDIAKHLSRRGLECVVLDLRRDRWFQKGDVVYKRVKLPGDPRGYMQIDLGRHSAFSSYKLNGQFYGADYDISETARFHSGSRHIYIMCKTALDADVIINLPKLKTHKKTGISVSLKNIVGVNGYRNCLPHFTMGTPDEGGDEFPEGRIGWKLESRAIKWFKDTLVSFGKQGGWLPRQIKHLGRAIFGDTNEVVRSGNWYGNDTAWRMVLDLNRILFYFDGEGNLRKRPLRYLTIVDGIIAGEGNGPLAPDAVGAGVVVVGYNPVAVDTVCSLVMGFDDEKVPLLVNAWEPHALPLVRFSRDLLYAVSNVQEWNGGVAQLRASGHLGMKPHFGWRGHIERQESRKSLVLG
jgi:uncharacterized protein (DUF362 family)